MTDRIDENPPMSIPEQAAEWLLRWHCGDLTIAERFEYLQWLKTSPVHIAETLRMCRLYSWLEGTKLKLYITNEDNFSNVVELPPREREAVTARRGSRVGLWKIRIAAGVAAIGLCGLLGLGAKLVWFDHTLRTAASEWRSVPLSDGSSITAAPYTKLHHDIGEERRTIDLLEGRALFRVAKDPARPFLVNAGRLVVKATGTQFTVEHRGERISVIVREGSVVVYPQENAAAKFADVSLDPDYQLTISGSGAPAVKSVDAKRSTEWAYGRLEFKPGDTVEDAVDQFNECNAVKIAVDKEIGMRPMRGAFDAIDPLSFAAVVEQSTGAAIVHETEQLVRITSRDPDTH